MADKLAPGAAWLCGWHVFKSSCSAGSLLALRSDVISHLPGVEGCPVDNCYTLCDLLHATGVPLAEKRLLDVKVGQLPSWLASCDFTPNGIIGGFRRGYYRYYNKYINVKKPGIGGITMFLAGYVVLSYIFNYEHLKHERMRKYH